jgi:hemerythrin
MSFISWEPRFSVGIPLIDAQHKQLVVLTNKLYDACKDGDTDVKDRFKETVHEAVEYVKYHFSTEELVMKQVKYPGFESHKNEHSVFVKEIFRKVQSFEEGKQFVPNNFVRFLRDWILNHIAVTDIKLAKHLLDMKRSGELDDIVVRVKSA